ncbi:Zn(2)-C6 fungal-type domain-containing protein [Mycena venus]|uniref:Zn(2)-C6 fungal-type domain-containing protein n=1 Tax=Mycena venus TaxID=2733690 RepID=A0A8H6XGA1_9AGAR|nr:Zn(2)-C6 fungal-type domain-containing protein [Mycena venus]
MSRNPSQPPSDTGSTPVQLSRPFRSRKNRPCDGCRRAKSRCAIPQAGPPCVECQQMNKQCTFDELPPERKKPKAPASPTANMASTSSHLPVDSPIPGKVKRPRSPDDGSAALQALSYAAAQEKRLRTGESEPLSLDLSISRSLDPHFITTLLTDDLLPIGTKQAGPDDSPLSETPHIRQISGDRSKPQYIIFTKKRSGPSTNPGRTQLAVLKTCLSLLDPLPSQDSLLDIYLNFSNPAFPLVFLPPDERLLDSVLHTKLCLTALSHCRDYRPSIVPIRTIVRASDEDVGQEPLRLSTISAALLDLSARPVLNVEANYVLLARTIAQAQLLGLHTNPTSWNIPSWEKDLRRTLWWGLRIHDAWMSFLNSRPSHIQADNHAIPVPDILGAASPSSSSDMASSPRSFIFLCRLSVLCSRLQSQVSTLASSVQVPAERLAKVKPIEEETQRLLSEVRRDETARSSSSGVASLMTCLLGFRCMLRRISIELSIGLGSPFTPDPATLDIFAEAVDYVCGLDARSFDGFWLNYVGHILSSLTSSLIRLSLATSVSVSASLSPQRAPFTVQASSRTMPLTMLSRLQRALQAAKRDHFWDLAEPALNRADSVASCLKSSSEYTSVVAAVKGMYEPQLPQPNGNMSQKSNGVQDLAPAIDQYGWNIDLNAFGMDWNGADSGLTGMWAPPAAGDGHVLQTPILPMYTD